MTNFKKKSIVIVALGVSVAALASCGVSSQSTLPPQNSSFKPITPPPAQKTTSIGYTNANGATNNFLGIVNTSFTIMPGAGGTGPYTLTSPSLSQLTALGLSFASSGIITGTPTTASLALPATTKGSVPSDGSTSITVTDNTGKTAVFKVVFALQGVCPAVPTSISQQPINYFYQSNIQTQIAAGLQLVGVAAGPIPASAALPPNSSMLSCMYDTVSDTSGVNQLILATVAVGFQKTGILSNWAAGPSTAPGLQVCQKVKIQLLLALLLIFPSTYLPA